MSAEEHFTVGDIAPLAQTTVTRVTYVIDSRKIKPEFRAAGVRVFSRGQVDRILRELAVTAGRPAAGRRGRISPAN